MQQQNESYMGSDKKHHVKKQPVRSNLENVNFENGSTDNLANHVNEYFINIADNKKPYSITMPVQLTPIAKKSCFLSHTNEKVSKKYSGRGYR